MPRDKFEAVRRDADRARAEAQAALDVAKRQAAEIAARLDELRRLRGQRPVGDDDRELREGATGVRDRRAPDRERRAAKRTA